jgi:mono/diheme cytochrome c family protein
MPHAPQSNASRKASWLARLSGFALLALPFVACFAEPSHEPSPGGVGASGGSAGIGTGAGGKSAGQASSGSSGGGRRGGTGGLGFDFGGVPSSGGSPDDAGSGGEQVTSLCADAAAEPLPARKAVTSDTAPEPTTGQVLTLTKQSLFNSFNKAGCGACHGGADDPLAEGQFQVTFNSFDERPTLGADALERIMSSDPDQVMPPDSVDGSKRKPDNLYRQLGERLLAWQKAGFPASFAYTIQEDHSTPQILPADAYLLPPRTAAKLTNLGNCIPNKAAMLTLPPSVEEEMQDKDALFASLETSEDLPDTIFETDLVSLDSATLSQRHVFSYAPTYTLYSDHAGKMRHLRVPLGQTIRYDADLRDFVIPDNTRFYKTFLKQVYDKDGNLGYRKMETRLIVVRQDEELAGGGYATRALRAAYAWDKDERIARRVKDPLRDTSPASDRLCPYVVDERVTRDPLKTPVSDQISEYCEYMSADELANPASGQIRHYAIPSTQRCDQCHMGSSSHSYILGFSPWQADRRKAGEGGVYEDPTEDELTQLERLLEYGVVSGIEPGQAKLEESQLIAEPPRSPRNDHELKAQGYMLGNCAFCHVPHGFPVVQNPILKDFELFPSKTGGIFQFPLEKFSPRAKVGKAQKIRLPYITAAFGDATIDGDGLQHYKSVTPNPPFITDWQGGEAPDYNPRTGEITFLGPWRSLIWRNVYTPFTYEEDGTIFIHMPRNAAGFDCRAQHIMAGWMLSIPTEANTDPVTRVDQPVQEVLKDPSKPFAFQQAAALAEKRVQDYENGFTGQWCPNDDDLVDPAVILSPLDPATNRHLLTSPPDLGITGPRIVPNYPYPSDLLDMVPDHAHWVPTDTTESPGKWVPRRPNWQDILVHRTVPVSDEVSQVIDDLMDIYLSPELEEFALEPRPMGLWHGECEATPEALGQPRVRDILAGEPGPLERWLEGGVFEGDGAANPLAPVHRQSRGEAVFNAICKNCHGKEIDSRSPLAATIAELTGGETRVANFKDGLFGPASAPGAYARSEFLIDQGGAGPDDWQARYVLFMGLGGTTANLPRVVLDLVATSPFYGTAIKSPGADTPNMLGSALQSCSHVLTDRRALHTGESFRAPVLPSDGSVFVPNTAHYELWESLCSYGNEPVVRVLTQQSDETINVNFQSLYRARDDEGRWIYPEDALVGNPRGGVDRGIDGSNTLPWCILSDPALGDVPARAWAKRAGLEESSIPFCPPGLFATALGLPVYRLAWDAGTRQPDPTVEIGNQEFTARWLRRGAMNAGLAAFYFMRAFTRHEVTQSLAYDFCR